MSKLDVSGWKTSEKLETLAMYLEKVTDEAFKMDTWCGSLQAPSLNELTMFRADESRCGTSACALGTAATVFSGLEFRENNYPWLYVHAEGQSFAKETEPGHEHSYKAGELFFGITAEQSTYLFDPCRYGFGQATKPNVIARLHSLAEEYRTDGC